MSSIVDHIEWDIIIHSQRAKLFGEALLWASVELPINGFSFVRGLAEKDLSASIPVEELSAERVVAECAIITERIRTKFATERAKLAALLEVES